MFLPWRISQLFDIIIRAYRCSTSFMFYPTKPFSSRSCKDPTTNFVLPLSEKGASFHSCNVAKKSASFHKLTKQRALINIYGTRNRLIQSSVIYELPESISLSISCLDVGGILCTLLPSHKTHCFIITYSTKNILLSLSVCNRLKLSSTVTLSSSSSLGYCLY